MLKDGSLEDIHPVSGAITGLYVVERRNSNRKLSLKVVEVSQLFANPPYGSRSVWSR